MEFYCRLGSPSGNILEGVYVSDSEARLRQNLEGKGLHILSLQRHGMLNWRELSLPKFRHLPMREFIIFNQELAALLKAGMPLVQSLNILRQRVENSLLKLVLDDVHDQVRSGTLLSEAFETHGELFPRVYTASLTAGEKSGKLEEVLRRYVTYARIITNVRRKTVSALIYPTVLLCLSLIVVAIIVLNVVPQFANFYQGMDAELPLLTQLIIAVSVVVRSYFFPILSSLLVFWALMYTWLKQPNGKATIDKALLRVPGIGNIIAKFSSSQLSRTLATLLGGGIPLVNALDVAAQSVENRHFSRLLTAVSQEVREGQALSASMASHAVFPSVAVKMVEVGESTGALQEMLNSVADFFDEEIETILSRFMTLIEPLLLVVMGIVIAGLLLALYLPLLQMGAIVQ